MMLTERRFLLVLVVILIFSTGCSLKPQVVYNDGTPAPTTLYFEKNFRTEMAVEAYISRIVREKEEDEDGNESTHLQPAEYLELGTGEVQKLYKDTVAVGGKVTVLNPEKHPYTLFVVYTIDYGEKWPYHVSRVLYMGDSEKEAFSIKREMEVSNPEIKLRVIIQAGQNDRLIEEEVLFEFETSFIKKE